jgi:hypothetical protein
MGLALWILLFATETASAQSSAAPHTVDSVEAQSDRLVVTVRTKDNKWPHKCGAAPTQNTTENLKLVLMTADPNFEKYADLLNAALLSGKRVYLSVALVSNVCRIKQVRVIANDKLPANFLDPWASLELREQLKPIQVEDRTRLSTWSCAPQTPGECLRRSIRGTA